MMMPFLKKKTGVRWDVIILPALLLLLAVLTCSHLLLLKNTHPGKILLNALQNMEQNQACLQLDIQEKGPNYKIDFQGNFKNNAIQGRLPAYGLEVYKHISGSLFVKDLKDGLWKKASELELQALREFFVSPFELLATWPHLFRKARFAQLITGKEKIILLPVPIPEMEKTALLRNYPLDNVSRLECLIFLEPDSLFINKVVFTLRDDNFADIVNRTFSFQDAGENNNVIVPAGVEQLLENQIM